MTFEVLPALIAGLAGTVVMTAMMALASRMGLTRMPPMTMLMGSMMLGDPERARRVGVMIHYIVMGTVVFGLAYAGLFAGFDSASVLTGAGIGVVHGVLVGAIAMPMIPAVHPRMAKTATADQPVLDVAGGAVVLSPPGFFASRWGSMSPVGLVVGHVIYGAVVALVYTALV